MRGFTREVTLERALLIILGVVLLSALYKLWTFEVSITTPEVQGEAASSREALLEAQLDQAEAFQEQLLQVVYFTLGGIVAVGILIAGFAWYQNRAAYDRELQSIRDQIELELAATKAELSKESALLQQTAREELARQLETVSNTVDRKVKTESISIRRLVQASQISIAELEANYWEIKGIWGNVLMSWQEVLRRTLDMGPAAPDHHLISAMNGIERAVQSLTSIAYSEESDLAAVLDRVPDRFRNQSERILQKLNEVAGNSRY